MWKRPSSSRPARAFLDTKQWDEYTATFAPDDDPEPLREATMVHDALLPEIDIVDGANARGTWAMHDIVEMPAGHDRDSYRGVGDHHEEHRKTDGEC